MYPYTRPSADYFRGTAMEPENIMPMRPSFSEYERLGKAHSEITRRIEALNEKMKVSRQSGAFQNLQKQMAEVKRLVKEREDLDGQMSAMDLARKKDDDYRIAAGYEASYSEDLESFENRAEKLERLFEEFSETTEEGNFDFTRCQRPNGTFYGTRGKCKSGSEVKTLNKEAKEHSAKGEFLKGAKKALKAHGIKSKGTQAKVKDKINKLKSEHDAARAELKDAKAALKSQKGVGQKARIERQILSQKLYDAEMKFGSTRDKLIRAVISAKRASEM